METNRIDYNFAPTSKSATARPNEGGGFADMLFDVMSKRADGIAADQAQIKSAPTLGVQSLSLRRRFDDERAEAISKDEPPAITSNRISYANQSQAAAVSQDTDRVEKCGETVHGRTVDPIRPDKRQEAGAKAGCSAQQVCEGDASGESEPDATIDGSVEANHTDDGEGLSLDVADSGDAETGTDNGEKPDPQPDPQILLALTIGPTAIEGSSEAATIESDVAPLGAAVTATPTSSTPAAEIDAAASLAAAALPAIADIMVADNEPAQTQISASAAAPGFAAAASQNHGTGEGKSAVTFAATMALNEASNLETASAQVPASNIAADNERRLEDSGNTFRRNIGNAHKATPVGQEPATNAAANAQNKALAAASAPQAIASPNTGSSNNNAPTLLTALASVGFDAGPGSLPGTPGWNLHLAQGAAVRRGDFVANLRQHLQNLPVHDQVALSIQRSVRDGGGSITLQLSPTELGRIHLKLNIDEENNVQASVIVERPATLDLLQRDMKALERALHDAGLKAGPGDLSFSLQGGDTEAFARDFGSGNGSGSGGNGLAQGDGIDDLPAAAAAAVIATGDGLVDVQV